MIDLYHSTSHAGAAAILAGGFRASMHGLVWLCSGRLTEAMMTGEYATEACVAVTVPPDALVRYDYKRLPRSKYKPNPLWEPRRKAAGAAHCPYRCFAVPVDIANTWPRRLCDIPDVPLSAEARAKAAAFDAEAHTYWKRLQAARAA